MYEFENVCEPRPESKSGLSDRPYSEASEETLRYADCLDRRNEKIETIAKASSIIDRYARSQLDIRDDEDRAELAQVRSVKARLAKAAGQSSRSFAKLSGKTYGNPSGGNWHSQREIDDPQSEAEAGIDFDSETDEVDVDDFLKMLDSADIENDDETSAHLHRCGLHLCKAKLAHLSGDHEQCTRSINAAMASYGKFHQALKTATDS
jgi:hypothetical protein